MSTNEKSQWPEVTVRGGANFPVRTVYGIGRNYADHAKELGNAVPTEPVVFLKAGSSIRPLASGATDASHELHFEAEIVLLVGRYVERGALLPASEWEAVDALALGLDLTRRGWQDRLKAKGLPWAMAKSFQGAALVSEFIARREFKDLDEITFQFSIGGVLKQRGNTRQMIFSVAKMLQYINQHNDLFPGDLVYTGTPEGVGPIAAGDLFTLSFDQPALQFSGKL